MTDDVLLRIELPLPLDVVATVTKMAGSVYPGATISTKDPRHLTICIPAKERGRRGSVKAAKAAKQVSEDPGQEAELTNFVDGTVSTTFPREPGLILAECAASYIDAFPDADNYVEQEVTTKDGRRFTFAVCRSRQQTPHQLRQNAEAEVVRLKARIAELEETK